MLHASIYSLNLYGCDIDPTMVKVSKINAALYVPWLIRPFPASFYGVHAREIRGVEQRNSLLDPP